MVARPWFPGSSCFPRLYTPVTEIEDDISEDHDKIQDIEDDHRIGIVEYLVKYSSNIADLDHTEKEYTLTPVAA